MNTLHNTSTAIPGDPMGRIANLSSKTTGFDEPAMMRLAGDVEAATAAHSTPVEAISKRDGDMIAAALRLKQLYGRDTFITESRTLDLQSHYKWVYRWEVIVYGARTPVRAESYQSPDKAIDALILKLEDTNSFAPPVIDRSTSQIVDGAHSGGVAGRITRAMNGEHVEPFEE